jgi:hypothetical protein
MIVGVPSFYAHILNGLFLLLSAVILYNNYDKITKSSPYQLLTLTLIMSIAIGIHGLSHLGLETVYGFNPMKIFYENNNIL